MIQLNMNEKENQLLLVIKAKENLFWQRYRIKKSMAMTFFSPSLTKPAALLLHPSKLPDCKTIHYSGFEEQSNA